jgi:hypothetical protein
MSASTLTRSLSSLPETVRKHATPKCALNAAMILTRYARG